MRRILLVGVSHQACTLFSGGMASDVDSTLVCALIDEMKHENALRRLSAMQRLPVVAKAINEERTRHELIPYIKECADDDDEVLITIADQMSLFPPLVGGPSYISYLLPVIEKLFEADSNEVRQKTASTMQLLFEQLRPADRVSSVLPMFTRLLQSTWYNSRLSAIVLCALIATDNEVESHTEVIRAISLLSTDTVALVRSSTVAIMPSLISLLPKQLVAEHFPQPVMKFMVDGMDSVRQQALPAILGVMELVEDKSTLKMLVDCLIGCFTDPSWRVKVCVAKQYRHIVTQYLRVYPDSVTKISELFLALLHDQEPEVRSAVTDALIDFAAFIESAQLRKTLQPYVMRLATDETVFVRESVAAAVPRLSPALGPEHALPFITSFAEVILTDEATGVRLSFVENMDSLIGVTEVACLERSLLTVIKSLAICSEWRTRERVIRKIPTLYRAISTESWRNTLSSLVDAWLADPVFSVREALAQVLCQPLEPDVMKENLPRILEKLKMLGAHPNYLHRITLLSALKNLASCVDQSDNEKYILPIALSMSSDPVSNIRLRASEALGAIAGYIGEDSLAEAKSALDRLSQDSDQDVSYAAKKSLSAL